MVVMLDSELVELYIRLFLSGTDSAIENIKTLALAQKLLNSPVLSDFTAISAGSGRSFVKSMSHCVSSRFKYKIRFCAAIFSLARRSISCSNSRSFRFKNWKENEF